MQIGGAVQRWGRMGGMDQASKDLSDTRSYDPAAEVVRLCQDLIAIDTSN